MYIISFNDRHNIAIIYICYYKTVTVFYTNKLASFPGKYLTKNQYLYCKKVLLQYLCFFSFLQSSIHIVRPYTITGGTNAK